MNFKSHLITISDDIKDAITPTKINSKSSKDKMAKFL
jgi:hypothetical protein